MLRSLFAEGVLFTRFSIVGLIATSVHFIGVSGNYGLLNLSVFQANFLAFTMAFMVSFLGHYHISFRHLRKHSMHKAFARFLAITIVALIGNNTLLYVCRVMKFGDWSALFISASVIPIVTYVAARAWAFTEVK